MIYDSMFRIFDKDRKKEIVGETRDISKITSNRFETI